MFSADGAAQVPTPPEMADAAIGADALYGDMPGFPPPALDQIQATPQVNGNRLDRT